MTRTKRFRMTNELSGFPPPTYHKVRVCISKKGARACVKDVRQTIALRLTFPLAFNFFRAHVVLPILLSPFVLRTNYRHFLYLKTLRILLKMARETKAASADILLWLGSSKE